MKENIPASTKALTIVLNILFAVAIISTVATPFLIDFYLRILKDATGVDEDYRVFIIVFLVLVGVIGAVMIFQLIKMLGTLKNVEGPFVEENTKALRRLGFMSIIVAVIFFVKCFFYLTPLTFFFGVLMTGVCLFAFTLAHIFAEAVRIKQENDYTI
jgi:hypothetical protein